MIGTQFIATRTEHHHGAKQGDATTEVFYKIERRVVGPVHVLEEGVLSCLQHAEVLSTVQEKAARARPPDRAVLPRTGEATAPCPATVRADGGEEVPRTSPIVPDSVCRHAPRIPVRERSYRCRPRLRVAPCYHGQPRPCILRIAKLRADPLAQAAFWYCLRSLWRR